MKQIQNSKPCWHWERPWGTMDRISIPQAHSQELSTCPSTASLATDPPRSSHLLFQAGRPRAPSLLCALAQAILPSLSDPSFQPCLKTQLSFYLPHQTSKSLQFLGSLRASMLRFAHFLPHRPSHLSSRIPWFTTALQPREHTPIVLTGVITLPPPRMWTPEGRDCV